MRKLLDLLRHQWLWLALVASAAMLATAHGFERFGGLTPCALCLDQRKVYWAAIAIAAVGLALRLTPLRNRLDRLFALLLVAAFLTGVFIAGRHSGIEFGWLPPLKTCGVGGDVDIGAMTALADRTSTAKVVPCDEVQWRFLGLSMAAWNTLVSLALAALSGAAALAKPKRSGLHG